MSLAYLGESVAVSTGLIDRILTLNPSYAVAWVWSGTIRLIAGDLDTAIAHLDTALRLDTRTSIRPLVLTFAGAAHLLAGRHDAAETVLNEAHRLRPQLPFAPLFLAASLADTGQLKEARDDAGALRSARTARPLPLSAARARGTSSIWRTPCAAPPRLADGLLDRA